MEIKTYIDTIVFGEIRKSHPQLLVKDHIRCLYVFLIYIETLDLHLFKIGNTIVIINRAYGLNIDFAANNKIILLFCGKSYKTEIFEKILLAKMNDFKESFTLESGRKSRECFRITPESYDIIYNFYSENFDDFFESTTFEISDDNTQYFKLYYEFLPYFTDEEITVNNDDEHQEDDNIAYLKLDSNSIKKYWYVNYKLYGKWKEDDGGIDQDDNYDKDSESDYMLVDDDEIC